MAAPGPLLHSALWHSGLDPELTNASIPAPALQATARAAAYGDSLFETILMTGNRGWLLKRHLCRLERGLAVLQLQPPPVAQVAMILDAAATAAAEHAHSILKLQVSAAAPGRGYGRAQDASSSLSAALFSAGMRAQVRHDPARVRLCDTRLAEQPLLAGVKHGNRLEQVLASNEWQAAGFDEGLMLSTAGLVIEGTHSNVIMQRAGVLVTPALARAGVAGVFRERLLELASIGVDDLSLADLSQADGLWLVNSVFGLRAVAELQLPGQLLRFDPQHAKPAQQILEKALDTSLSTDLDQCSGATIGVAA
ncbi:MAG: aminotransferase class IV [Pseudomonadales bacterium]